MDIKEQFQQAIATSKTLNEKPDNETLLNLYTLYKQGTDGDANGDGSNNMFDFVAKAKHNAWSALKGTAREDAQNNYVQLVTKLKG